MPEKTVQPVIRKNFTLKGPSPSVPGFKFLHVQQQQSNLQRCEEIFTYPTLQLLDCHSVRKGPREVCFGTRKGKKMSLRGSSSLELPLNQQQQQQQQQLHSKHENRYMNDYNNNANDELCQNIEIVSACEETSVSNSYTGRFIPFDGDCKGDFPIYHDSRKKLYLYALDEYTKNSSSLSNNNEAILQGMIRWRIASFSDFNDTTSCRFEDTNPYHIDFAADGLPHNNNYYPHIVCLDEDRYQPSTIALICKDDNNLPQASILRRINETVDSGGGINGSLLGGVVGVIIVFFLGSLYIWTKKCRKNNQDNDLSGVDGEGGDNEEFKKDDVDFKMESLGSWRITAQPSEEIEVGLWGGGGRESQSNPPCKADFSVDLTGIDLSQASGEKEVPNTRTKKTTKKSHTKRKRKIQSDRKSKGDKHNSIASSVAADDIISLGTKLEDASVASVQHSKVFAANKMDDDDSRSGDNAIMDKDSVKTTNDLNENVRSTDSADCDPETQQDDTKVENDTDMIDDSKEDDETAMDKESIATTTGKGLSGSDLEELAEKLLVKHGRSSKKKKDKKKQSTGPTNKNERVARPRSRSIIRKKGEKKVPRSRSLSQSSHNKDYDTPARVSVDRTPIEEVHVDNATPSPIHLTGRENVPKSRSLSRSNSRGYDVPKFARYDNMTDQVYDSLNNSKSPNARHHESFNVLGEGIDFQDSFLVQHGSFCLGGMDESTLESRPVNRSDKVPRSRSLSRSRHKDYDQAIQESSGGSIKDKDVNGSLGNTTSKNVPRSRSLSKSRKKNYVSAPQGSSSHQNDDNQDMDNKSQKNVPRSRSLSRSKRKGYHDAPVGSTSSLCKDVKKESFNNPTGTENVPRSRSLSRSGRWDKDYDSTLHRGGSLKPKKEKSHKDSPHKRKDGHGSKSPGKRRSQSLLQASDKTNSSTGSIGPSSLGSTSLLTAVPTQSRNTDVLSPLASPRSVNDSTTNRNRSMVKQNSDGSIIVIQRQMLDNGKAEMTKTKYDTAAAPVQETGIELNQ